MTSEIDIETIDITVCTELFQLQQADHRRFVVILFSLSGEHLSCRRKSCHLG